MSEQLRKYNLDYEFIEAVDGRLLSENELENICDYNNFKKHPSWGTRGKGIIGCALSHQKVYKKIVEKKLSKALILEDLGAAAWVIEKEDGFVDPVTDELETFVNGLLSENLNSNQHKRCFQIKNLITDIERVGDLTEDLAEAAQKKNELQTAFSQMAIDELDERLTSVAAAAETFDTFLNSLRDLLFDLQGPPPTPMPTATTTITATASPSATPGTIETLTPTSTPTPSGPITRTPRPTLTPIATSTPEPQP